MFTENIPSSAVVFWYASEASPRAAWMVLRRANYFSPQQLSGQMFNRQTALLGKQLNIQVEPVTLQAEICEVLANVQENPEPCRVSEAGYVTCAPDMANWRHPTILCFRTTKKSMCAAGGRCATPAPMK